MRTDSKKLKLLYLMEVFKQNTDETHGLTLNEIAEKMNAYDFTPERKSLYTDFDALSMYGFCIESDNKRPPRYRFVRDPEKDFSLAELKLVGDCIRSSKFMPADTSALLMEKFKRLLSENERRALDRQIIVPNRAKKTNFDLQHSLDCITQAIDTNLQIKFRYAYLDEKKRKRFRKKAETDGFYFVSPYKLIYSDDNYFLLAYDNSDRKPKMKHFRVDKMDSVSVVIAEREGAEAFKAISDIDNYTNYTFSMHGGEVTSVTLVFINHLTDTIVDRFGDEVVVTRHDETHSKVIVSAALSDAFYAWVFSLGKRIKITAPQEAIDGMKKMLEDVASKYED